MLAYCMRLIPRHFAYRSSGKEKVDPEELKTAGQKLQVMIHSESFPLEREQLVQEKQSARKTLLPFNRRSLDLVAYYGPPVALSIPTKLSST